jgi:hypothetical protein
MVLMRACPIIFFPVRSRPWDFWDFWRVVGFQAFMVGFQVLM